MPPRAIPWLTAAVVQAAAIAFLLVQLLTREAGAAADSEPAAADVAPRATVEPGATASPAAPTAAPREPASPPPASTIPADVASPGAAAAADLGTLLHGVVAGPDRMPVKSVYLSLFAAEVQKAIATTSLYQRPEFAFPGLAPGDYRLTARGDGMRSFEREFTVPPATPDLRIDVALVPSWLVKVVLQAPDGRPLSEAMAQLKELPLGGPFGLVNVIAAWQELPPQLPLSDLSDTPFNVAAWKPRGMGRGGNELPARYAGMLEMREDRATFVAAVMRETLLVQAPVQPGQDEVTLVVDPLQLVAQLAAVRLQVVDEAGKPVPKANVGLNDAQSWRQPATTDADGRFEQTKMRPGRYQLTIGAEGSSGPIAYVDLPPARTTDLGTVVLVKSFRLRIRLVGLADDKRGSANLVPLDAMANAALTPRTLRLGMQKGEIQANVAPGRYRLRVTDGTSGAMLELDTRQLGDEPFLVTLASEPTLRVDSRELDGPARLVLRTGTVVVYDRWITWRSEFSVQLPAGEYRATTQGLRGEPREEAVALPATGGKLVLR
ncbi:MAG TPA: carboxypeptidase-like regulatory domain-containing protein [Planctomycetota bacterium]|nr:carboxypeptidase-like regulatory domain-containing protein [Planctomycetota bacterium]